MRKIGLSMVCILLSVLVLAGVAAAKDKVVIYTSLENEEVVDYIKAA
ncbi:MAG: hypothetical protein GY859_43810, partial [Desulfobacterales bacterium]|nr:hypothetical protein [Desulfobacterales bacterium]